jgi:hypothetical protein
MAALAQNDAKIPHFVRDDNAQLRHPKYAPRAEANADSAGARGTWTDDRPRESDDKMPHSVRHDKCRVPFAGGPKL